MKAYYNEINPFAAQWLRNLIAAGHIAPGDVDERDIRDVQSSDLAGYIQCHFFAGIGVWSYALRLAGWPDDRPVWTGSCPCQPFSAAGKGKGTVDSRHLWPWWYRLIRECRPVTVFGEQVAAAIRHGWLDLVSAELEGLDYAVGSAVMGAHSVGAPHIRQRLYFVADRDRIGHTLLQLQGGDGLDRTQDDERPLSRSESGGGTGRTGGFWSDCDWLPCIDGKARPVEPGTFPLVDWTPARVGRLRAYGNAIVPQVAAEFIRAFTGLISWEEERCR